MKNLFLILNCFLVINLCGQNNDLIVSVNGKTGGIIKSEELINSGGLKVSDDKSTIEGFTLTVTVGGFAQVVKSNSCNFTDAQKRSILNALPGNMIFIDEVKIKISDGTIIKGNSFAFKIDGVNADISRDNSKYLSTEEKIINYPMLYVYPSFNSDKSTGEYNVKSFKISSIQSDCYYEFNSKSNSFSPQMLDFIKKSYKSQIVVSDILAIDKSNKEIKMSNFDITLTGDYIIRKKADLLNSKKINFISPKSNCKIISFTLNSNGMQLESKNDLFTNDIIEFIKKCNVGKYLEFNINYKNSENIENAVFIRVKVVE